MNLMGLYSNRFEWDNCTIYTVMGPYLMGFHWNIIGITVDLFVYSNYIRGDYGRQTIMKGGLSKENEESFTLSKFNRNHGRPKTDLGQFFASLVS